MMERELELHLFSLPSNIPPHGSFKFYVFIHPLMSIEAVSIFGYPE